MDFIEENNLDINKILINTVSHEKLLQEHLQDKDYQRSYLETSLEEFAKDGNIDAFIRSLQYVIKARGHGAISSLAKELKISALTVKKAYDNLENEGFTVTIHGKGTYVTATNTELLLEEQKKELESDLERVIQKGRCYGISEKNKKISNGRHAVGRRNRLGSRCLCRNEEITGKKQSTRKTCPV